MWKSNKWVKYLEGYCQGKNQIQDEYVRKVAQSLGLEEPLNIRFEWQQQIAREFDSTGRHEVIILTGTAGDGKTKLCRDIVRQIDGNRFDENIWNASSFFCSQERTIVKDFSDLSESQTSQVITELLNVLKNGVSQKPILIAVNDGIFVDEIDKFLSLNLQEELSAKATQLKEIIEDKINLGFSSCHQQELIKLVNLSKLNAKENFSLILDEILGHSGWSECDGCEGKENGLCPIYQKYELLKDKSHIRENLSNIILLLQLNNEHFTIRELLNLATNTILAATPKPKSLKVTSKDDSSQTYTCRKVKNIDDFTAIKSESSIEVGFWGMNLGQHKMNNARPYSEINKLDFGELSTNYWDNLLKNTVNRDIEIPLDSFNNLLTSKKSSEMNVNDELWGAVIKRSRIQIYCYQDDDPRSYELQKFASFSFYKKKIFEELYNSNTCNDFELVSTIILALNRVFHGRYISDASGNDRVYIPEKDQGSITPISIFHAEELRHREVHITKIKGDFDLIGSRVEPVIELYISREKSLKLALTVELFDFLYQVSKGAPPNTTNPRLYKKLLIFRSKLATQVNDENYSPNKRIEIYTIKGGEFKPSVLQVNHD